jgi:hypothetical protein
MSSKIQGLLSTCERLIDKLATRAVDWTAAIVAFGDLTVTGDTIQATPFSNKVEVLKKSLHNIPRNSGGGNEGESSLEALHKALSLKGYRRSAMKVFIFMTDEPALKNRHTPSATITKLRKSETMVFVISDPLAYFKQMAAQTGGDWFQIKSGTDFLSILDKLFKKMGETITDVQKLTGGDVGAYLRLRGGS